MMKKTLLFIFIILLVLSIGNVSATNDTDTSTSDITNHDDVISENTENNNTFILSNENAQKSMAELENTTKNNKNTTILLNNDYQWTQQDTDLEKGIILDKSIVIDGQGHTIDAKSKMRIFQVTNNAMLTFKNITFLNGKFYSIWSFIQTRGGAVWNNGAKKVTLINCTFTGNNAGYGGAIYGCTVINCIFTNNVAIRGGGIYGGDAINCTFMGNNADNCGGGIYGGDVINCIFTNNVATNGGGIYDGDAINCIFTNNNAHDGGGIYDGDAINCIFTNNNAHDGGGIYDGDAINCTFTNNNAKYYGGAIYRRGDLKIINCIFTNNVATHGGAIHCRENLEFDNCTFIGNHADDYGGAIYADTITWTNNPSYFIGNYDDNQGGAIYTNKFETDVKYAVFINNTVKSNDDGGAIYINEENHITFTKCYFENNCCGDEGGAIYLDSRYSHLTLKDNRFINNIAGDEGQTVFNKGYYDEISYNYWGNKIPSTDNDQLVEWKQWTTNIKHIDNNPFYFIYKTMTELQNIINNENTTIFLNDDYQWIEQDTGLENGIIIDKSIIIDGQEHKIDANHKMRIFQVTNNAIITFKNIIFSNGLAANGGCGGAVWNNGAQNITIINCTFTGNTATYGGAISGRIGDITNCTFTGNSAAYGGAIYIGSGGVSGNLGGTFINNVAKCYGGAIYIKKEGVSGNLGGTFINNRANSGGAIIIYDGVSGNLGGTFINNRANYGGAITICDGVSGNLDGTFINNTASEYGGAIYINGDGVSGNLGGTFINNTASEYGGAIYIYVINEKMGVIQDCIFINNGNNSISTAFGNVTAINCWFGNNATNYNIKPQVGDVSMSTWLFLNATANPTKIIGKTSIIFKLDSYNDTSKQITSYNASKTNLQLDLSQTLGKLNKNISLISENIIYTAGETSDASVTGKIGNVYYIISFKNNKVTFIDIINTLSTKMSYDIIKYLKMQQKYFVNTNSIALDVKYLQNLL